ncbi:MDR family MFS transporter [Bifidobacterium gallicum]|uniref:MFS transporter n=1 Tax=Bifidobacterium gallicum DSM 20093 = LMG 11596 TaxID=561180 RepID=D1NWM0_9BIFI|nr:MDR family MFS transporter [Bifidobacterium gallicum]EFA22179.1 drug resistance MFS transporter, drug:H+ antiporter-2 family [Bifidobacterium gallicum DSM 20093 = LMG 11596]KFI59081.1 MFS transporter [Bifidobacterium gallicum DSM 20093 = LMG 11596]
MILTNSNDHNTDPEQPQGSAQNQQDSQDQQAQHNQQPQDQRNQPPQQPSSTALKPYTRDVHHETVDDSPAHKHQGLARFSQTLSRNQSYRDGHLTHAAFVSLAILTFITFMGNFTQLQLSAALPTIVEEFGITVTTGQWLTSVFQLIMGIMVPLTAYLTRRFSTRQIVLASMLIFTLGSALAWLSPSFLLVLVGRMFEAVGTGVMWPVLQITVFSIFPLDRRGAAMGLVGMAMSVAPAIGPTLGGIQTDANGWRSIFVTLTFCGVAAMLLAFFFLRNFGEVEKNSHADFFSVALSVFGFGGLMFGFTNIQSYPMWHPIVWAPMLIGVIGIVWFVVRQTRNTRRFKAGQSKQPALLDLSVLKNRNFRTGTIIAALSFFAFSSIVVIMPMYIQTCRGYSATISGLVMLPGALGQAISQYFGGRALDKFGARPVALTGTIVLLTGTIMMSFVSMTSWIWWVSISQFTRQIGMGFVLMPLTTWSLNCLPPAQVAAGSAVTNTARQIAGAIGAPVLILIMSTLTVWRQTQLGGGANVLIEANVFGVQWALRVSACLNLIMVLMVLFLVRGKGAGSAHDVARRAIAHVRHTSQPAATHTA